MLEAGYPWRAKGDGGLFGQVFPEVWKDDEPNPVLRLSGDTLRMVRSA